MRERWLLAANIALFLVLGILMANFQTVIWYQFVGAVTAPALWLLPVVYFALHRRTSHGVVLVYPLSVFMASMTVMPAGLFLLCSLMMLLTCISLKDHVNWEGYTYAATLCALGSFLFNFYNFMAIWVFNTHVVFQADFLDWIIQALMTAVVGPFFFEIFAFVDRLTKQEQFIEQQIQIL